MKTTSFSTFTALLLAAPAAASAAGLFGAHIDNGPVTISTNDSNFVDTITHLAEDSKQLLTPKALAAPFTATVTYMGVPHDLMLVPSFSGGMLFLRMRSVGFDQTFTGRTPKEVQDKLEDYLNANGMTIIAKFNAASAFKSAFAITDGNPASTTASAARSVFFSVGLPALPEDESGAATTGFRSLTFSRGHLEAEIAGHTYAGDEFRAEAMLFNHRFGERVRVEMPISGEYTELEGTEVYGGGATLITEITLLKPTESRPFGWRVAPVLGVQGRVSFDAVAGGLTWHTGLVSVVDWRLSERFTLSLINQATIHRELPVDLGDYALDPDISQTILKNGVALTAQLSPRWRANAFVINTHFLDAASVPDYNTVGASLDYRAGKRLSAGVGVESDFASNYHSLLGRVSLNWRW